MMVRPDQIKISLGIETLDQSITTAKNRNLAIMKSAITAFQKLGVPEKEIQTDHLSIQPCYRYGNTGDELIGYTVRNNLIITISDSARVEEIVTSALESGVNYIHGIDFQTTEFRKYRDQARELALKAAREKAVAMAATLGQAIAEPRNIVEVPFMGSYLSSWTGFPYNRAGGMSQNALQIAPSASSDSDAIVLGQIPVRANVNVVFELTQQDQAATTTSTPSPLAGR